MDKYEVAFEVAGPVAMFARPDTGGTPTSYPVPTWSAAKGLFESIAFLADGEAWICPTKIEVCRRIGESGGQVQFQRYTTNYGGPLRKPNLIGKGANMQFFATILGDVCYRLHGVIVNSRWKKENNPGHHLHNLFNRRLRQGRCYRTPCLGWSEFTCSYWGPDRAEVTEVDTALSLGVPSMLLGVWDSPTCGQYEPEFRQNVKVVAGVLKYEVPERWLLKEKREVMTSA
ncbi:MAG: CRISPR-associated protein Cas5 [Pseudomonadota bacterium]